MKSLHLRNSYQCMTSVCKAEFKVTDSWMSNWNQESLAKVISRTGTGLVCRSLVTCSKLSSSHMKQGFVVGRKSGSEVHDPHRISCFMWVILWLLFQPSPGELLQSELPAKGSLIYIYNIYMYYIWSKMSILNLAIRQSKIMSLSINCDWIVTLKIALCVCQFWTSSGKESVWGIGWAKHTNSSGIMRRHLAVCLRSWRLSVVSKCLKQSIWKRHCKQWWFIQVSHGEKGVLSCWVAHPSCKWR